MEKNRVSKAWYEHEKFQLWVAFEFGVPFDIVGQYLKRSRTSINKQIERYGLRDRRLAKPRKRIKSFEDFNQLLIQCGLDTDTVGHERAYTRSWQPSITTVETLARWGLNLPTPWQPKPKPKNDTLPKRSGIGRAFRYKDHESASLGVVISYLGRYGIRVCPLSKKAPHYCSYSLNNVPVKEYTLLVQANKLRRENGEPIFVVEGITTE